MRRVNWFPTPNMQNATGMGNSADTASTGFVTVNGMRWLRCQRTADGDAYAQYALNGGTLPPAGTYHVNALAYTDGGAGTFRVYARVGGTYKMLVESSVANKATVGIDKNFTVPADCDQLLVRISPPSGVNGFMMLTGVNVESKATYDARSTGPTVFDGDTMPYDN